MPHALFTLLVLLASFGLYLLFAGQISATELIAAGPTALACAAAAFVFRLREERAIRLPSPPLRALSRVLAALVLDSGRVGLVLLRSIVRRPAGDVGTVSREAFDPGSGRPDAAGRRALVTLGGSLAPNGYVLRAGEGESALLLHRLAGSASSREKARDREWPV